MNYVEVNSLYKSFAEKNLFENASFKIERGDKIALIANNGAGKTTLINIILGNELPDKGEVILRNDIHVNFLRQDSSINKGQTILETIFESQNQFIRCIRNYRESLLKSKIDKSETCIQKLQEAINQMDIQHAWNYENRIEEILEIFEINNLNQKVGTLSGGQQKRLALAKVLIDKSDLLFLDEPTNHLDIGMIEWLENYLKKEKITLFLISHDRYFIDNVCDTIFELDNHKIYKYKNKTDNDIFIRDDKSDSSGLKYNGAYTNFLIKKAEREEMESKIIEKARSKYRVELEWMRRQPQARQHKSKKRIETFYDIAETAHKKKVDEHEYNFELQPVRLGKKIMEVKNISKSYDDKVLIKDFTHIFQKTDKIGVIGKNGCGKSTFFNIITKSLTPDKGNVVIGSTVRIGYFGQTGPKLNEHKKIIDIVKDITEMVNIDSREIGASQFLTKFNFPPAVQHNTLSKLSGGEKRRLYLLLVLLQQPNFLILDEPTNDLDIRTLNLLEEFLSEYEGVVLVASHDRLFIDKLADHVFAFEENGIIKKYPGNYTQYSEWKDKIKRYGNNNNQKSKKDQYKESRRENNDNKPTYKQKKEYEELTKKIESYEQEKKSIMAKMNDSTIEFDELNKLSERFGILEKSLSEMEDRWLELSEIM